MLPFAMLFLLTFLHQTISRQLSFGEQGLALFSTGQCVKSKIKFASKSKVKLVGSPGCNAQPKLRFMMTIFRTAHKAAERVAVAEKQKICLFIFCSMS